MAGAEILGDDRRHRAEAAAEAQQHDGVGGRHGEEAVNSVHQPEHHDLNSEYQRERADGPDAVGYGAPEKAAERIEQRDSAVRCRDYRGRQVGQLLHDGHRIADDKNPGGHVQKQHQPQQIELRSAQHFTSRVRKGFGRCGAGAAGQFRRRIFQESGADSREHGERDAGIQKHVQNCRNVVLREHEHGRILSCLCRRNLGGILGGGLRGGGERRDALDDEIVDDRTQTEAHDHHPSGQTATLGEPLGHHGDRSHVSHADAEAADQSVGQVQPAGAQMRGAQAREKITQAPEQHPGQRDLARPDLVLPAPADHGACAKRKNGERKSPGDRRARPPKARKQRLCEQTPRIDRAERHHENRSAEGDRPAVAHQFGGRGFLHFLPLGPAGIDKKNRTLTPRTDASVGC